MNLTMFIREHMTGGIEAYLHMTGNPEYIKRSTNYVYREREKNEKFFYYQISFFTFFDIIKLKILLIYLNVRMSHKKFFFEKRLRLQ